MRELKILHISSFYEGYLNNFYRCHPEVSELFYRSHYNLLMNDCFAWADFFEKHLNQMGFIANQVIVNDRKLQDKWCYEHNIEDKTLNTRMNNIIQEQIRYYDPDIIFFEDPNILDIKMKRFLSSSHPNIFLISHYCAPSWNINKFKDFNLIISCINSFHRELDKEGINVEQMYHGFEPTILNQIGHTQKIWDFSFVGSLSQSSGYHKNRYNLIKEIFEKTNLEIWTPTSEVQKTIKGYCVSLYRQFIKPNLSREFMIMMNKKYPHRFHLPVYGLEMYKILSQSKITLNNHVDAAGNCAGNMRLFEATGVGTLLITDWKKNLSDLFEPDKEVITYKTPEECIEKVNYFLENDKEREAIARAGQKRTLTDHTIEHRMTDFKKIIETNLITTIDKC